MRHGRGNEPKGVTKPPPVSFHLIFVHRSKQLVPRPALRENASNIMRIESNTQLLWIIRGREKHELDEGDAVFLSRILPSVRPRGWLCLTECFRETIVGRGEARNPGVSCFCSALTWCGAECSGALGFG